ncbi:MAG: ATP-binding protein, partial [Gimesia chilikensis]
ELTYQRLVELAEMVLDAGWSVIVDATTLQVWQRSLFRELAVARGVRFVLLCFEAEQDVLEQRIEDRQAYEEDPSDATRDVLQLQLDVREPLTTEEQAVSVVLPTKQEWTTKMLVQLVTG